MTTRRSSKTLAFKTRLYRLLTPYILRRVSGHSMTPTLHPGKIIVCRRTLRIAFGDVVIAQTSHGEIVKRVLEVKKKRAHLAGDNHGDDGNHDAGWVANERIVARVVWPRI